MSIVITNVSRLYDKPYGSGEQYYEVRINDKFLFTFTHTFEYGLSKCLEEAAKSAMVWQGLDSSREDYHETRLYKEAPSE